MKTAQDPRHLKRIHTMQELFAWDFNSRQTGGDNIEDVIKDLPLIDGEREKAATTWPLDKINNIDFAILRLAVFELIIVSEAPFKVIVDEAVELAKEFGTESSPSFVNGALGNVISANELDKKGEKE